MAVARQASKLFEWLFRHWRECSVLFCATLLSAAHVSANFRSCLRSFEMTPPSTNGIVTHQLFHRSDTMKFPSLVTLVLLGSASALVAPKFAPRTTVKASRSVSNAMRTPRAIVFPDFMAGHGHAVAQAIPHTCFISIYSLCFVTLPFSFPLRMPMML